MKIPFYISFKEFKSHYEGDLEKWFLKYPDASEIDYLKDILKIYSPFYADKGNNVVLFSEHHSVIQCYWSDNKNSEIEFVRACDDAKEFFTDNKGNTYRRKYVTHLEYAQIVVDKIKLYLEVEKLDSNNLEFILKYLDNEGVITKKDSNGYELVYHIHELYIPFIKQIISKSRSIVINLELYRNFGFSIVKIINFINSQLEIKKSFGSENMENDLIYTNEGQKPTMYYFRHPYFPVYLEEYIREQVTEMLFSKIIMVEKELKYLLSNELKEKYLLENASVYQSYNFEDFDNFKKYLKFSINYLEKHITMDQGWLFTTVEYYNNNERDEFFSTLPHPDVYYASDAYVFIRITEEDEMYVKFDKCKKGYIELLIDFLFYSFLLDKLENISSPPAKDQKIQEYLNIKQKQKIGLLVASGIVNFLRTKYPNITNNQIAGFFELISQEPLKQKSTNTHFTKDKSSSKYPIQNNLDEVELNLILSQFGMKKD